MPKKQLLVFITHPAYGHENAFAGLYVALGALSKNVDATVVLACNGIYAGIKDQNEPLKRLQLPPIEEQLRDIMDLGGEIFAVLEDADQRGVTAADIVDGVQFIKKVALPGLIADRGELQVTF